MRCAGRGILIAGNDVPGEQRPAAVLHVLKLSWIATRPAIAPSRALAARKPGWEMRWPGDILVTAEARAPARGRRYGGHGED